MAEFESKTQKDIVDTILNSFVAATKEFVDPEEMKEKLKSYAELTASAYIEYGRAKLTGDTDLADEMSDNINTLQNLVLLQISRGELGLASVVTETILPTAVKVLNFLLRAALIAL